MPDQKISQLTAATTPLTGTELVPLVQSGGNVKATTQDIAIVSRASIPTVNYTYTGTPTNFPMFRYLNGGSISYGAETFTTTNAVTINAVLAENITGLTSVTWTGWGGHLGQSGSDNLSFLNIGTGITSMSFPDLVFTGGYFGGTMTSCASFAAPILQFVGGNFYHEYNSVTTLTFPQLRHIRGGMEIRGSALTSFTLPEIVSIAFGSNIGSASINFPASPNLTTLTLGPNLKRVGPSTSGNVTITSCALNQDSVDNVLVRLAALDGTNGTTLFSNRTVTITGTSSAPSATGAAAKATLIARGCTVTTN